MGEIIASFLTLTVLEIVLGIDNLLFIAIITARLPEEQQLKARRVGLMLAVGMRLALLASLSWLMHLTNPLFTIFAHPVSLRDIILIVGGLFLLAKGTTEIHNSVEGEEETGAVNGKARKVLTYRSALMQIMALDVIFSLDSVITAVGMSDRIWVMSSAIIAAVIVMVISVEGLSRFIHAHLSVKLLALSFLIVVGLALVADGLGFHIPKGYLYFAIAFSAGVEGLNIRAKRKRLGH